jgi:hypothetical protein
MELLWLAIVFYSAGLAAVLYLRPTVMFNENGTWKEFGYQRDSRHTLFPFWLFVITWAIVSYVLSMAVSSYLSASAVTATATAAASHSFASDMFDHEDDSESEEEEVPEPPKKRKSRSAAVQPSVQPPVQPPMQPPVKPQVQPQVRSQDDESFGIPVSRAPSSREKPRPGYYVLDPEATTKPQGLRKYVYYGPSPPTE